MLLFVRLVVKVPRVQSWLVRQVAGWLTDELQVKVEVASVDIRLFRSVVLNGVFIQDQQKDTLICIPELEASISQFSYKKQKLTFSAITLKEARIGLKFYKDPRKYNIDFLIDYFSSSQKDTTASKPWAVRIRKLQLQNCHFTYRDYKFNDADHGIDWEDLALKKLNVVLEDIEPEADTLRLSVKQLSFVEKSGFNVIDFSTRARLQPGLMDFEALKIRSEKSLIQANVRFNFKDMEDFQSFVTNVHWKGDFTDSKVDFADLSFFASELDHLNRSILLKGSFSGTVDRFKGKGVELRYTDDTYFKGNVNMTGLPDFFETYMELKVDELAFNTRDLETIPAWPFDSLKRIELPSQMNSLGQVRFKGSFNGFYNDFVAYGNMHTALGFISSDLNLKIGTVDRQTAYKGNLRLNDFDIGKFWGIQDIMGKTSLKAKLEGKGFDLKNINARIEGEINSLGFYKYSYSNIKLNGHFAQRLFTGELVIADRHLDMDFEGEIDLTQKLPVYNFNSSIRKADLTALNLLKRKQEASLHTDLSISLIGNNLDNAQGTIQADDFDYTEGDKHILAERIFLESRIGDQRELNLVSDFADVRISGDYSFSALPKTLNHYFSTYIPALLERDSRRPVSQQFSFKAELKKTDGVLDVFLPQLGIEKGTVVEGTINTDMNDMSLRLRSAGVDIRPVRLKDFSIDGHTEEGNLVFSSSFGGIHLNDSVRIRDAGIKGFTNRDTASVLLQFSGQDSSSDMASCYIQAGFLSTGYTMIKLLPEKLLLHGRAWNLSPSNYILADSTGLLIHDFSFSSDSQRLDLSGVVGKDTSSTLQVEMVRFDISQFNDFLSVYNVNLGGIANGKVSISSLLGKPALDSDLEVKQLTWYRDSLGDAELQTVWDSRENRVDVEGTVTRGGTRNIHVSGYYLIREKDDELNFTAQLQKTYVQSFSHYLDGLVSDMTGIASGELYLRGTANKPELTGKVYLQKIGFTIDYLNTSYSFSTEVEVLKDRFEFKNVVMNDVKGNPSIVNGSIRHEHLDDFYFDLDIKANKAQVLNTGPSDNDIYYGVAYASGTVSIKGYLDYITMNIGLKSEKGTKINLPLSNPEEVSRSGFINFINVREKQDTLKVSGPDFSGIALNMDFEVTQDASIYLIFDSKIGDIIEGKGDGNITMRISPSEDMRMFGGFTIEEGKYLFTMQNIINKPFYIDKGGYVRWTGDPYDATVNIKAIYKLRAGLYDLFQDSSFRKLVPVELNLHLTEKLFNPNIAFDINVLNIDPNTENQIRRLINTEEEKYRQAVSLLVMRRFTSPSEISNRSIVNSTNVVGVNAYEMLSNQLSNWASQISNQVNVGVNYRPGDALTSEELEVALSTSLFNDRVTIDGNVGVANSTTPNANQNTSNLIGDFTVEVKANKDGRVRLKAFNRSNNNSLINNINSPYTQGVGVFYSQEFNTFAELTQKLRDLFRKKSKRKSNLPDVKTSPDVIKENQQ
ncbi:MAG: translocation/assembly module TamB domain-containing protein [Bacteroidia bacterium]|nr:translocation/assembly module TamB domain-containing protein [Bacteroidia bacterium]